MCLISQMAPYSNHRVRSVANREGAQSCRNLQLFLVLKLGKRTLGYGQRALAHVGI